MDTLPAISLWQPWAQLIAFGAKRYETRSWRTSHRGPMAIHAGAKWTVRMARQCYEEPFFSLMARAGVRFPARCDGARLPSLGFPFGAVVAVAELVGVRPAGEVLREIGGPERAFGDFSHGRWAWEYRDVVRLAHPVPCRGQQGIFRIEGRALDLVKRALGPSTRGEALASICADWIEAQDRDGAVRAAMPIPSPGINARGENRDEEEDAERSK